MTLRNKNFSRSLSALVSLLFFVQSAAAIPLDAFSVFGAQQVFIGAGSTIESGLVGSNTEVRTNGAVTINEDIHSGGTVTLANSVAVFGSVFASGDFSQGSAGGRPDAGVGGNIDSAGQQITVGPSTTVGGSIVHVPGATVTIGNNATVTGGVSAGVPTAPSLPVLPAATVFASGGSNVVAGGVLTPGSYGALNLGNSQSVTLSAGNYFFDSWDSGNGLDLLLDLTGGQINLYITGLAQFGNSDLTLLNGTADKFFLEGHQQVLIGAGSSWYGLVYAPFDLIRIGGGSCCTTLTGALWSGTVVDIEHGVTILAGPDSSNVVPEPSTWMLLSLGLFAAVVHRVRSRRNQAIVVK